jgi:hypothetical protein
MKYIVETKNIKRKKNLKLSEFLYLCIIYYYLFYALNGSIAYYNNDETPSLFLELFPGLEILTKGKNLDYNVSDRSILVYFIIIDLIRRPIIPFSRIVKFNIVLTYLMEFSLIIVSQLWEIFATKNIIVLNGEFREEASMYDTFYSIVWIIYAIIYIYCSVCAFQGKYPRFFKPFNSLPNSIHLYLNSRKLLEVT